ncbi:unnamed protein product [Protopolystoma xenopodis]|uniref:Kinesin motor domain-containing protein n=1 Tax=Protopolystoma xenopodis TaxID=117903 RepID=A0A3S5B576_9PLAT|nr:unnamed protein product [Protopolystoma xenopodis]
MKLLKVVSQYSVIVEAPEESYCSRSGVADKIQKFTYSQVFSEKTNQHTVFREVVLDRVREFLEGLNSLVFTYGTTSSGKTFTLHGTLTNVGIIPRALDVIFNSIKHHADVTMVPKDFSDITRLTTMEAEKIVREKDRLLKLGKNIAEEIVGKGDPNEDSTESSVDAWAKLLAPDRSAQSDPSNVSSWERESLCVPVACRDDLRFTLWISYAEIYNEIAYDLLDPVQCAASITQAPTSVSYCQITGFTIASAGVNGGSATTQSLSHQHVSNSIQNMFSIGSCGSMGFGLSSSLAGATRSRRTPLDLRTDKNGNIFIKGLRWYPISSPEEAFRLLLVGRRCQQVAATRLNQASSRSHSIFTIKAVRVVDKQNPQFARISAISFCDLAGSERSEKAATGGQNVRLREAGNINTSLLTLGRCVEFLRYNQTHRDNPKLVPYRDSKLTRLFQGFFTGRGKACMIVNASQNPSLFDETLHALRFSALARDVVVRPNLIRETALQAPQSKSIVDKRGGQRTRFVKPQQPPVDRRARPKHDYVTQRYGPKKDDHTPAKPPRTPNTSFGLRTPVPSRHFRLSSDSDSSSSVPTTVVRVNSQIHSLQSAKTNRIGGRTKTSIASRTRRSRHSASHLIRGLSPVTGPPWESLNQGLPPTSNGCLERTIKASVSRGVVTVHAESPVEAGESTLNEASGDLLESSDSCTEADPDTPDFGFLTPQKCNSLGLNADDYSREVTR